MKPNPNSDRCKVLIAEDRKLLREGLCALLGQYDGIHVVGEVEDARAVLLHDAAPAADVLVMTAVAAQGRGTDVVRALVKGAPSLRLIVLTIDPTPPFLRELLDTGIHGCLNKDSSATQLVDAIRSVMGGERYVSPKLLDVMASTVAPADAPHPSPPRPAAASTLSMRPLAPREREILRRIAGGESTKQIARALGVGTKTVETHRRRLMHKLNLHTVAELTKYAVIHGLTPLEALS